MNPDTNKFEELREQMDEPRRNQNQEAARRLQKLTQDVKQLQTAPIPPGELLRPNGSPVPKTWSIFQVGEHVVIKDYTFKVAYISETNILFEPVGPVVLGEKK